MASIHRYSDRSRAARGLTHGLTSLGVLSLVMACGGSTQELGRGKRTMSEAVLLDKDEPVAVVAAHRPPPGERKERQAFEGHVAVPVPDVKEEAGGKNPWEIEAEAESFADWQTYQHEHRYDCAGPRDTLEEPFYARSKGRRVVIEGSKAHMEPPSEGDLPTTVRVGIISAVKDIEEETLKNLDTFLAWFEAEQVDVIVVNGDVGYEGDHIEPALRHIGKAGWLTVAIAGNADPIGSFNLATKKLSTLYPNVVNGNFVRLVEIGQVSLIMLPGYHDPRFLLAGRGCQYYAEDVTSLDTIVADARATPVLVAHGPPRGKTASAPDYAFDAGNVGDPAMNGFMKRKGVNFGLFGHILESGGRAVDPSDERALDAGVWSERLWINAGAATSVGSDLHDGTSHAGMAAIVEFDGQRARYWTKMLRD